jgi:hypothetical protein
VLSLSLAMFIDSNALARNIITSAKERLGYQMDGEGKFPKEMERTIALHYNTFDLHAFFMIAAMAEKTGIDIWHYTSPSGSSLQKGFAFLKPFLAKEKEWTGQQIKPFEFEEGYPILLMAKDKYGCAECPAQVKALAGAEAARLRENLLY